MKSKIEKFKGKKKNTKDDFESSSYARTHKKRPTCPWCGSKLYFTVDIGYEFVDKGWSCSECIFSCGDYENFPDTMKREKRAQIRKEIQENLEVAERRREFWLKQKNLFAKYMEKKELVKAFGELLKT